VRVGKRAGGRDGVETVKAEDDRIKYVLLCNNILSTFVDLNISTTKYQILFIDTSPVVVQEIQLA
jgi:hypothetical protein